VAKIKTRRQLLVENAILAPLDWIDERSGAVRGTKWFLFRYVPRDISWAQTLGFASLIAFTSQALTGVILAMYYKPSSEIDPETGKPIAYSSIEHITNDVTLGWLVRGMHRWGASVFVILMFLHMGRVFLFGAYKYPRELNWIIGVLILVTGMLMGFTGYLLPWDQTAYWATVVGINLNGTAPFAGPWLAQFLASGPEITSDALPKWYSLHMLVLPGALIGLILVHLYLVARLGVVSPPWSKQQAGRIRGDLPVPEGTREGLVRGAGGGD
jgi:quinol-cytochrome oxidoreductase complex cytochrome b subunit